MYGGNGLFVDRLGGVKSTVRWVARADDDDDDRNTYYRRVRTEQQNAGDAASLAFRRGGGACLGHRQSGGQEDGPRRYIVRGAPKWWSEEVIENQLRQQRWEEVRDLHAPRSRAQRWLVLPSATASAFSRFAGSS